MSFKHYPKEQQNRINIPEMKFLRKIKKKTHKNKKQTQLQKK